MIVWILKLMYEFFYFFIFGIFSSGFSAMSWFFMRFFWQTGLHLLTTANAGSDESIVEDGMSSVSDNKRSKNEVRNVKYL